ncbi:MAG: amino acid ABC transporter substrate-binding protein [Rhodospirillaceae bacterium]|jgi:ABC-type amino acid transport substrate-binding protein|nr:amino acid ABC transporter substrate-binding protein [Rhodospirillaceae bacterium]MBT4588749.1 amino acid ABC transporter substrate-binding protein [Rhodospirillaceae bacterium]MBT5939673.1 amino acid ABC transporter substrate-binding protein [Rhodospirillaceae bacterium]MBT7267780.1 amino acid ABC transporter substrate-binding protein [Rhodospirillaceae bacterium]
MIKIAVEPDFLPLTSLIDHKASGQATGMIIEILEAVFADTDLVPEFVPVPLAQQLTALNAGDIDAIAFKAITPGHDRGCDFSLPIIKTGAAWFAPKGNPWTPDQATDRSRIATPGTGPLAASLRAKFPKLEILETVSYDASLKAVVETQADVAALNFHIGCYLAERGYSQEIEIPAEPYEQLDAALAVNEGDPENILGDFNTALERVIASGLIPEIETKWLKS